MRWIPIALMGMHGLIHLMGFAKGFGYADLPQFTQPISRARGLVWPEAALLSAEAQKSLCLAYDELSRLELQALPQIADDVVRARIDKAVAAALGLKDDLSLLRMLLGAEPIISMQLPA